MKVSVIIPVYNTEKYLEECVKSVIGQTYKDLEVILVNDGSVDNSGELCEKLAKEDNRIITIHKENGGQVSAWKAGLEKVTGEYISFIDSDDFVDFDYIETLVNNIYDAEMVCMNFTRYIDNDNSYKQLINHIEPGLYKAKDLEERIISDKGSYNKIIANSRPGKLIKTEIVKKIATYCTEEACWGEDQPSTIAMAINCINIKIIDEYKYYYRYNATSVMNNYKENLWQQAKALIKSIESIPDIEKITNYKEQLNSQTLLYLNECFKNEFINKTFTKKYFDELVNSNEVISALGNYEDEKMGNLDKKLIRAIKQKKYNSANNTLNIYRAYCKIRNYEF